MKEINFKDYQEFAHIGIHPFGKEKNQVVGFALGLGGEAGEVLDIIKKREYRGKEIPDERIKEELGDVMWYIANLCNELHFDLGEVLTDNMNKLIKRYPEAYPGWITIEKGDKHEDL